MTQRREAQHHSSRKRARGIGRKTSVSRSPTVLRPIISHLHGNPAATSSLNSSIFEYLGIAHRQETGAGR
jgi:hypothetical protein